MPTAAHLLTDYESRTFCGAKEERGEQAAPPLKSSSGLPRFQAATESRRIPAYPNSKKAGLAAGLRW
ncbi:MAG: hypothetical protein EPO23_14150 [Xanthobacteraceae bacterium]|nr:MAG: hypothetical protein EPO23_14150 [Xanthobacteraceae bacterium]